LLSAGHADRRVRRQEGQFRAAVLVEAAIGEGGQRDWRDVHTPNRPALSFMRYRDGPLTA